MNQKFEDFSPQWGDHFQGPDKRENIWLWNGYLAPGNITLLTSQWKSGKTTLISVLLARLREGGSLAGLPVRQTKAVIISEENVMHWYARNQKLHFGDHVCFFCQPFTTLPTMDQWLGLLDQVGKMCRQHPIGLLVIDPLANFLPGHSENLAETMLKALAPLRKLSQDGLAICISHHPKKGKIKAGQASRGSGALASYVDILLEMAWFSRPFDPDRRRVIEAYSRHEETPRRLVIELTADGTDYLSHGNLANDEFAGAWKIVHKLLGEAGIPVNRGQILARWPTETSRPNPATLWRWLEHFLVQGLIVQKGQGRRNDPFQYQLAEISPGRKAG